MKNEFQSALSTTQQEYATEKYNIIELNSNEIKARNEEKDKIANRKLQKMQE